MPSAGRERAVFGNVRTLPSGRFQARWRQAGKWQSAKTHDGRPLTFDTKRKARTWLNNHAEAIRAGTWSPAPPAPQLPTLKAYAADWLKTRRVQRGKSAGQQLADRTRDHYAQLLRDHVEPTFGASSLDQIAPDAVEAWFAELEQPGSTHVGPVARAHAYSLLNSVLATAADRQLIERNPCAIPGAGQPSDGKRRASRHSDSTRDQHETVPATLAELGALVEAMPERLRLFVQLACWTTLRFGEITELRRADLDVARGVIRVRRGYVDHVPAERRVKTPKSRAGRRDVPIPPHVADDVRAHLSDHTSPTPTALLFTNSNGAHLARSTFWRHFERARKAAGRPDLTVHDLRHTGLTYAAATGASLRELMDLAGHSSHTAAMRYQHTARGRLATIASGLEAAARGLEGAGESTTTGQAAPDGETTDDQAQP